MAPKSTSIARRRSPVGSALAVALLLVTVLSPGLAVASTSPPISVKPAGTAFVNITATSGIAFAPSQVTVAPGMSIDFTITQAANFAHSFVLSGLVNFSFASSATDANITEFFRAHAPLVNLSLGSTPGSTMSATIGALAVGSYEFVCIVAGHFQSGMHGELVVSTSGSAAGGSNLTLYYAVVGVIVVVVIAAVALLLLRRRGRSPTTKASPPPAPSGPN